MSQVQEAKLQPLLSLASQIVIYGLSPIGRRIVIYFAIPLLTTYMGMDSFGVVSVLISLLAVFDIISSAGLPPATFRLYNEDDNPDNQSNTLGSSLLLFVVFAVVLGLVIWIFAGRIAGVFLGDSRYTPTVRVVAIVLPVMTLIRFAGILFRIQVRPLAKVIVDIFLVTTQLLLGLVLVIRYGFEAFGYWAGQLAGAILALALGFLFLRNTVKLSFSWDRAKELLYFALPLLPASLGLWSLGFIDRSLITASIGLSEAAIYEIGYKVGLITSFLVGPFTIAWPQFAFSRLHSSETKLIFRNVQTAMAAGAIFLAIFVISFRDELVGFLAPEGYGAASDVVPWIALSQVAWALYPVFSVGPEIAKKTISLTFVSLSACLINLGLNLLLIPQIGILGAAIAAFVGYWVLAIVALVVGRRFYKIPFDWRRLAKVVIAACVALLIGFEIAGYAAVPWQKISLQVVGMMVYPALLLLIGFVSREQLYLVWQVIRLGLRESFSN